MEPTPPSQLPHKPSRKQAIVFFVFTLILAVGVVTWVFFVNKGTVSVDGAKPFNIKIGTTEISCTSPPCSLRLAPRSYNVVLSKKGFYDDLKNIKIKLWGEEKITADFKFIPTYKELGEIVLPVSDAPLRPPFLERKKFENFPKDVKQTKFSQSGDLALITLGKELYIYYVADRAVDTIDLKPETAADWLGDKIIYLEESEQKHLLKLRDGKENKLLASFERPLKNPTLFGSPDGKKILLSENSDEKYFYYIVDTEKRSRKRLEISASAHNPKWAGDYMIFEEGDGVAKKVFAFNPEDSKKINLLADSSENVIEIKKDVLIFISGEKRDSEMANLGPSISEALEQAAKDTSSIIKKISSWFVTEFNVQTGKSKMLIEIPTAEGKSLHRLTADPNGKKLYLDMDGALGEITLEFQAYVGK